MRTNRNEQNERLKNLLREAQAAGAFDARERFTPACAKLVEELWDVGVGAIQRMLESGEIATAGPSHRKLHLHADDWDFLATQHIERDTVAVDMVVAALPQFLRKVVDNNRWDGSKSSLATFWINSCLLYKFEALERWAKPRRFERRLLTELNTGDGVRSPFDYVDYQQDLSEAAYMSSAVEILVRKAKPTVRPILAALADGETIVSAAHAMGISAGAARTRLYEFRRDVVVPAVGEGYIEAPGDRLVGRHVAAFWATIEGPSEPNLNDWPPRLASATAAPDRPEDDPF